MKQKSVCDTCEPGYYCVPNFNPRACPQGFYCPAGTGYIWQSCPPGTYGSATLLSQESDCTSCDGGFYCQHYNDTIYTGPCDAGYFCTNGSDSVTPDGSGPGLNGPCPEGHYCPQQTQFPIPCPAGTFNNVTMLTAEAECQDCPPGSYCEVPGLSTPSGPCSAGFYCLGKSAEHSPSSVTSTGGPCPAGKNYFVFTSKILYFND